LPKSCRPNSNDTLDRLSVLFAELSIISNSDCPISV
jgi:hypothetical protein